MQSQGTYHTAIDFADSLSYIYHVKFNKRHNTQIITWFLGSFFCLYTIGLPIVIASCPMMANPSQKLACCVEASGTEVITPITDRSCCATKFAATRNTTEYIQSKLHQNEASVVEVIIPVTISEELYTSHVPSFVHIFSQSISPPHSKDIPVLISSLRI